MAPGVPRGMTSPSEARRRSSRCPGLVLFPPSLKRRVCNLGSWTYIDIDIDRVGIDVYLSIEREREREREREGGTCL